MYLNNVFAPRLCILLLTSSAICASDSLHAPPRPRKLGNAVHANSTTDQTEISLPSSSTGIVDYIALGLEHKTATTRAPQAEQDGTAQQVGSRGANSGDHRSDHGHDTSHDPQWTSRHSEVNLTAAGQTGLPHLAITQTPKWSNTTARFIPPWEVPSGNRANASTVTCHWNDTQCLQTCSALWSPCADSWSSWSARNLVYSSVGFTSTFRTTWTSTSYQLSTSVWTTWATVDAHKETFTSWTNLCGLTTWSIQAWPYYTDSWIASPGCNSYTTFTSTYRGGTFLADKSTYIYALNTGTPVSTFSETVIYTQFSTSSIVSTGKSPPSCTYIPCTSGPNPNAASCRSCQVQGGTVELLYWADLATTSLSTDSTWMPYSSKPVTAVYKNTTLTSPTVYIDFKTAYATNACGQTLGTTYPGALLAIDPQSLYSIQGQFDYFVEPLDEGEITSTFYQSARFDFQDLSGLVPGSVYQQQPSCLAYGCVTILRDYHPVLALPSQIRDLDPAWKHCGIDWHGAWDPPIALQPAQVIDPVLTSAQPQYTTAAIPGVTLSGPASQTAAPMLSITTAEIKTSVESSEASNQQSDSSFTTLGSEVYSPPISISTSASSTARAGASVVEVTTTLQVIPQQPESAQNLPASPANDPSAKSDTRTDEPSFVSKISSTAVAMAFSPSAYSPNAVDTSPPSLPNAASLEQQSGSRSLLVIGGQTVSLAHGGLAIGSSTLQAGGDGITISSVIYSAASDGGLVVISNSVAAPVMPSPTNAYQVLSEAQQQRPAPSLAGPIVLTGDHGLQHTLAPGQQGGYNVDGTVTLQIGQTTSISGLGHVFAGSDGLIVSGGAGSVYTAILPQLPATTQAVPPLGSTVLTFGSATYSMIQVPGGDVVVDGGGDPITLAPDYSTTLANGASVVLGSSGDLVVAESTYFFSTQSAAASAVTAVETQVAVSIGLTTLIAAPVQSDDGLIRLGTQTLTVGGAAVTSEAHTLSAVSNGILEDGTLMRFTTGPLTQPASEAVLTLGSSEITAVRQASGEVAIGGQTLSVGGSGIVLQGYTISAGSGGIVEDGTTSPLFLPTASTTAVEAVLTFGDSTLTAIQASQTGVWVIGSRILSAGGPALVSSGHTFSVASSGLLDDGHAVTVSTVQIAGSAPGPTSRGGFLPVVTTASAALDPARGSVSLGPYSSTTKSSASAVQVSPLALMYALLSLAAGTAMLIFNL